MDVQTLTLIVLFLTLISIVWYSWETRNLYIETRRMRKWSAKQTEQIEKQLVIEQTPLIIVKDRITVSSLGQEKKLHMMEIENVGRGSALNVTVSFDPERLIPAADGSNPNSVNLYPGARFSWALDDGQVRIGLTKQGIKVIKSIIDIPEEEKLKDSEKSKADFYAYLSYEDSFGNKFITVAKVRHWRGDFFKVMENKINKASKS